MRQPRKEVRGGAITLALDPKTYDQDSVLGAAHLFAGRAQVWVDGHTVTLEPGQPPDPRPVEHLAQEFLEEAASQELRRRIAALNRPVREYIVTQALMSALDKREADGSQEQLPLTPLSKEQESEIARLIQEAEAEIREREQRRLGSSDARGA